MSDTPETDACWDDKECNILEHARRIERERDSERALSDRLAQAITDWRRARWGKFEDTEIDDVQLIRDTQQAITAWKEARSE